MLSRVADALFWMSRYIERAESVARLLDVGFLLDLDLRGVLAGPRELHWTSLAAILQQRIPASPTSHSPQETISHWLSFDLENPASIMTCINRARNNARSIRGSISAEMWKELNKLYWQLRDSEFAKRARESPHDYYQAVECGSYLFQGVTDATLVHDEGWQFIQLGKYLERAEKTVRVLDIKYHLLQDLSDSADLPLLNLQWAGVLRSCRAYDAYQRLHVSRLEPREVVQFLLLHPDSPRSIRFCLESAARAVEAIWPSNHRLSPAERLLGQLVCELKYGDIEQILSGDLHGFLQSLLERCNQVGWAVQQQYSLHTSPGETARI